MKITKLITLLLVLFSTTAFAQDIDYTAGVLSTPGYFIIVVSGVLLACGFQFLLTALSVAGGVTAVGNLKEAYVEGKYERDSDKDDDDDQYEIDPDMPTGVIITSAIGIWNVLTVGVSLFFATMLALRLVPMASDATSITLALTIWAAFFMLMFYLEGRLVGTLVGGLINTAVSGLKASGSAVANMLAPSPVSQVQTVADNTIEKLRQEMSAEFDTDSIVNSLNKFAGKVENKIPDYENLKADLKEIARASAGKGSSNSPAKWTAIQTTIQSAIEAEPGQKTDKAKKKAADLKSLLKEIQAAYKEGNSTSDSLQNALKAAPVDEKKVNGYINQVKELLQNNTSEDMNPQKLQAKIESIINDPQGTVNGLQEQMQKIDRQTIVELLNKNTSLDKTQINQYANKAERVFATVTERLGVTNDDPNTEKMMTQFEGKVRAFINGTDTKELNYGLLKNDFKRAMNNPSESLNIVKRRLSTFDRNTLVSVLTATPWLSREDIDRVADTVENARNEVDSQVTDIQRKARRSMANIERRAVIQAEHTRKTAVSAAWWLVATIIISGLTAVTGGLLNM